LLTPEGYPPPDFANRPASGGETTGSAARNGVEHPFPRRVAPEIAHLSNLAHPHPKAVDGVRDPNFTEGVCYPPRS
jgi:hypothetical protein